MNRIFAFLLFSGILILAHKANGATIHWGNAPFDTLIESDGTTTLGSGPSTYTARIGYFEGLLGAPSAANADQWGSSFRVFDQASFNTSIGYFTGSANLNGLQNSDSPDADPATVFPENTQAYVWISNGGAANTPGTEWALLTNDSWDFPDGDTHVSGPLAWKVADAGTTAVFGDLGSQASPGEGVMTEAAGAFTIQTATFIPEPSSSLLALLGALLLLGRRRR